MYHEILSAEQPCILCGQTLLIVTVHQDPDSGEEKTERTLLEHSEAECRSMIALYPEIWPMAAQLRDRLP